MRDTLRLGSEGVPLEVMAPPARGVFESLRAYGGRLFRCHQHLARLRESCHSLGIRLRWSGEVLEHELTRALTHARRRDAFVRLAVYANEGHLERVITAHPLPHYPKAWYAQGTNVVTSVVRRAAAPATDPKIKASSAFLLGTLCYADCADKRIGERLFLNQQGHLTEGTTSNVFIVKRGALLTPPTSAGVLAGVSRQIIFELAPLLDVPCRELNLTRHDLYTADEAFLTSTSREVMPIYQADRRVIGDGARPVTRTLQAAFRQLVARELGEAKEGRGDDGED